MKKANNLEKEVSTTSQNDWSEIWKLFRENELRLKETDLIIKELAQDSKETEKRFKELAQDSKETERRFKDTERFIKNLSKQIGGVSNSNGDVAEAYFFNSFKKYPHFAEQDFESVEGNVNKYSKSLNLRGEYDLLLSNGSSVAIIEIKYKAKKEDVAEVVSKVENFKVLFPQYKDYAIYLGLAGLSVEKGAEKEAIKQGVGIIKQVGKNMVINDAHLKVF